MALKFTDQKGGNQKSTVDRYTIQAENSIRLVGDVLPKYDYWVNYAGKSLPFECLSYNRAKERFDNIEKDHVKDMFPDLQCGWAYAMQCIDLKTGKLQVFNLKKKLFQAIMELAKDLGDPTDPVTGWDIYFTKVSTGSKAFNVEYRLQERKCTNRALNATELALIANLKSMEDIMPRATPEEQKASLDRLMSAGTSLKEALSDLDEEIISEFDIT
jgi:hypothetical protein